MFALHGFLSIWITPNNNRKQMQVATALPPPLCFISIPVAKNESFLDDYLDTSADGGRVLCTSVTPYKLKDKRWDKNGFSEQNNTHLRLEEKKKKEQIFHLHTITCHYSCLQQNRLPHLVNSSVTSRQGNDEFGHY